MLNLIYVGNISEDNIISDERGKLHKCLGGSTVYSSHASKCVSNKLRIGIIGNTCINYKNKLEANGIEFLGNVVETNTEFYINEVTNECLGRNYNMVSCENSKKIETQHLHVSFRKGINIEQILNNQLISYNTLSIDVMIHSVKEMIPVILKYLEKINIIFCNMDEYKIIKEYLNDKIKIVVTNNSNPILFMENGKVFIQEIEKMDNVVSTTGAGDSFVGGFLGEFVLSKNLNESIQKGVITSQKSILGYGPLIKCNVDIENANNAIKEIPKKIVVIGNSCAGKSTFVKYYKELFDIYEEIDDIEPLKEIFKLDDMVRESISNLYIKDIKYCFDIVEEYKSDINNINFYTQKAINGNGHVILRPVLWNKILKYSLNKCEYDNLIIQFSRGKDEDYEKEYNQNAYLKNLLDIDKKICLDSGTIIINLQADLEKRIIRNEKRRISGGHYVEENTMKQIYSKDIFEYLTDNEVSFLNLDGKRILVYNLNNNKIFEEDELQQYMRDEIIKIIKYYNKYKED